LFGLAFPPGLIKVKQPAEVTLESFLATGFVEPFIVHATSEIGLQLPPREELTVTKIAECLGANHRIPVIDVERQATLNEQLTLLDWSAYFATPVEKRLRVYNVISLEITNTPLAQKIRRPTVARELDLVDKVWPTGLREERFFPKVQLFCLMSAAKSFTDFHIDFGGSSVFYTVVSGEKIFFLVPPTPDNLRLYEQFAKSANEAADSLPEMGRFADLISPNNRYVVTVKEGDTLFIPSGWIHAVQTPVDTVVIGGNFLHSLALEQQIQIHKLEKRARTLPDLCFPYFEAVMFYTAEHFAKMSLEEIRQVAKVERAGLLALHDFLVDILQAYARSEWKDRMLGFPLPFPYAKCQSVLLKLREHLAQLPPS